MKDDILKLLDDLGIEYRWQEHPAVFTVADTQKHLDEKKPVKNLLLKEKGDGKKLLVIMNGESRLDTKQLAKQLGLRRLSFANEDLLKETLDLTPGAVSLFGLMNDGNNEVLAVIDSSLLEDEEIGFHPNINTATIFFSGKHIEEILKKLGNKYEVVELPQS